MLSIASCGYTNDVIGLMPGCLSGIQIQQNIAQCKCAQSAWDAKLPRTLSLGWQVKPAEVTEDILDL